MEMSALFYIAHSCLWFAQENNRYTYKSALQKYSHWTIPHSDTLWPQHFNGCYWDFYVRDQHKVGHNHEVRGKRFMILPFSPPPLKWKSEKCGKGAYSATLSQNSVESPVANKVVNFGGFVSSRFYVSTDWNFLPFFVANSESSVRGDTECLWTSILSFALDVVAVLLSISLHPGSHQVWKAILSLHGAVNTMFHSRDVAFWVMCSVGSPEPFIAMHYFSSGLQLLIFIGLSH